MQKYLYFTVFIAGLASLALEMTASRLLGNIFGTSNIVWASIIGLILIFLSIGYFLGGPWADRSPFYHTLYQILIWASITIALVPVISRPVLRLAANAFDQLELGVLFGSFITVFILLCFPTILLGTTSPFAIRLAIQDTRHAGGTSGRIYAVSTLGSFLGTFIPVLWLIPTLGTYRTFFVISYLLLLVGMVGYGMTSGWRKLLYYLWAPALVGILAWLGLPGNDKTTKGLIYETESAYNYIQVLQQDGYRLLRLNEGQGIHSMYHPTDLDYHGPWEQVLAAPFFNQAPYSPGKIRRVAILGLAAGTTARQITAAFGSVPVDGIEIDPKIVEVGRQYFDMNEPNLNIIIQDGRWALSHSPYRYQIISIDAYRPPYIPYHMTTQEFFKLVYDKLDEDGVMVINVGRAPNDRRLINTLTSTIRSVFPSVHVMDIPGTFNSIIYASHQPSNWDNLVMNLDYLLQSQKAHPILIKAIQTAISNRQSDPPPTQVFTDDKAPIEWITNQMILQFLFSGNSEQLE